MGISAFFSLNIKYDESAGERISESYVLEYGTDCLEMHVGAVQPGERAVVIDDLVATGGTLSAAIRLLGKLRSFHIPSSFSCIFFSRYATTLLRLYIRPASGW